MQMHGIYLAAIITIGIAAAIFVPVIHRLRMPADERLVWLAAAFARPMQPLAFYLIRVPLDHWLAAVNFVTRRYERCPHCRRWHWTRAFTQT